MPISHEQLLAAARRMATGMMHSDDDLAQKLEPAVAGPEAGPSNDELVENSHTENGQSPVIDGDLHSPERANVNAMREAIETQAEMEVGKPIAETQQEVKTEEKADAIKIDAQPGKQIIINIAGKKDKPLGGEKQNPRANVTSGGMGTGAFGGTDLAGTPNMEKRAADYWGYDDWITGHTALLINNESAAYSTLKNLVRNALKKKMTPKELAAQFARFFKKQAQDSKQFYAENAQGSRDQRGEWERKQLEGVQPSGDKVRDIGDKLMGIYYEMGGESDWEQPSGEVNWEEIATSEMESERAENPEKYPKTNKEDDKLMKGMGIKMESLKKGTDLKSSQEKKAMKTANLPIPQKGSPEWHQLKIAIQTLQMNSAMAGVMGGPSKEDARVTLQRYGINPAKYESAKGKQGGEGEAMTPEDIEKEAGFNFFFPGQVLREIAPELQHNIVDYPNDNNTPMQYADVSGDAHEVPEEVAITAAVEEAMNPSIIAYVSTSPAAAAGIGRDGKTEVMEGLPIRKENDIRGMMFTDEFYGQFEGIPGKAFASVASLSKKIATMDEAKVFGSALHHLNGLKKIAGADEAKQFSIFLKKVCGEIAATFVYLFKVTSAPMLDKVPGKGEIQLAQVEQPQGLSSFNVYNQASRVKYLMDKLTDSEIKDAINGSSAQGAVWHDGEEGGYVYEVFVRIDDIDTESLIATYSFIIGTKE